VVHRLRTTWHRYASAVTGVHCTPSALIATPLPGTTLSRIYTHNAPLLHLFDFLSLTLLSLSVCLPLLTPVHRQDALPTGLRPRPRAPAAPPPYHLRERGEAGRRHPILVRNSECPHVLGPKTIDQSNPLTPSPSRLDLHCEDVRVNLGVSLQESATFHPGLEPCSCYMPPIPKRAMHTALCIQCWDCEPCTHRFCTPCAQKTHEGQLEELGATCTRSLLLQYDEIATFLRGMGKFSGASGAAEAEMVGVKPQPMSGR